MLCLAKKRFQWIPIYGYLLDIEITLIAEFKGINHVFQCMLAGFVCLPPLRIIYIHVSFRYTTDNFKGEFSSRDSKGAFFWG